MSHYAEYSVTAETPCFLASEVGKVLRTNMVKLDVETMEKNDSGRYIVPAGTLISDDAGKSVGILYQDVDVTMGDHEASVLIAGRVWLNKLPAGVYTEAIIAELRENGLHFDTEPITKRS